MTEEQWLHKRKYIAWGVVATPFVLLFLVAMLNGDPISRPMNFINRNYFIIAVDIVVLLTGVTLLHDEYRDINSIIGFLIAFVACIYYTISIFSKYY